MRRRYVGTFGFPNGMKNFLKPGLLSAILRCFTRQSHLGGGVPKNQLCTGRPNQPNTTSISDTFATVLIFSCDLLYSTTDNVR